MVSWWGIDPYLNIKQIQIGDIEIIISTYGSSGLFGYRLSSKSIGHNTYTGRRIILHSKPTPIHGKVHKCDFNYSYSIIHFSRLPQAVAKKIIYHLSQKVSNASNIIDLVINGFSPNYISINLHIYYHSIVTFRIREKFIGF